MKKLFILLIFLFVLVSINAKDFTNYSVFFSPGLNTNLYFANFSNLPGVPNCCNNFTSTYSIRYSLLTGIEYKSKNLLFSSPLSYLLGFSYNELSGSFIENEFIGNIIQGNTYSKGISEHTIKTKINSIGAEPSVLIQKIFDIPLSLKLGIKIDYLISKSFEQSEKLIEPSDAYFENKSKERNRFAGDLNLSTSILFSAGFGIRWTQFSYSNIRIEPELSFYYGFNNLVKNTDWKISNAKFSMNFVLDVPKAELLPPAAPPIPDLPIPSKPENPKPVIADVNLIYNNKIINENDTIFINSNELKTINQTVFLPVIFFKENTTEIVNDDFILSNFKSEEKKNILSLIIDYAYNNSEKTIILSSFAPENEDKEISEHRISFLKNLIIKSGISAERVKIDNITQIPVNKKNSLRIDELRYIKVRFSGTDYCMLENSKSIYYVFYPVIKIKPETDQNSGITAFEGNFSVNNKRFGFGNVPTDLDSSFFRELNLALNTSYSANLFMKIKNEDYQDKQFLKQYYLKNRIYSSKTLFNPQAEEQNEHLLLAFFNFDEDTISVLNEKSFNYVYNELRKGRKIELIPSTDDFGSAEHNKKLAQSRANAVLNLFKEFKEQIVIKFPVQYQFSNSNPYGRLMNRTVSVILNE